ncbi:MULTISPECIES: hypothetical protein [Bacillota]|jgi:hypothetical protein|uniref:CcmD family protein n=1 Tax=Amedibacillus hominis TaxID=2897776 RepID=A0ABS9R8Z4_9FIRM|nr:MULTISPECIES: hypothetical protein [Bacillota]MCH4286136.1 hypothetical protein [Amedibacillus hominis]
MSEYFIAKLGYLIACILVFYIILSHIDKQHQKTKKEVLMAQTQEMKGE